MIAIISKLATKEFQFFSDILGVAGEDKDKKVRLRSTEEDDDSEDEEDKEEHAKRAN